MDKVEFPIIFKECPNCHSKRSIVDAVREQHKQGDEKVKQAMTIIQTPVANETQMRLALPVPWVTVAIDACADCGALYCIMADVEMRPPPSISSIGRRPV